jgi:uncharacterized NAD-dependent epimerase/dehydratase family protein
MTSPLDGHALVYCDGAFATATGKTAHGLVRRTRRYKVEAVLDRGLAGKDAGEFLDGRPNGVPIVPSIAEGLEVAKRRGARVTHFVFGLALDGGRFRSEDLGAVREAIRAGLNVDAGLHDFLGDMPEIVDLAKEYGVRLRDVRKTPDRRVLHAFSGRIREVGSLRVALLGTDSAVGKRTTAWLLKDALDARGHATEMIGTGQTAWMQGARYGILLDSLVNDFVAGELEHAVLSAWDAEKPAAMVIEGQGSLMHPAYPGGGEILAATQPHAIVVQHAPARAEYDGFPGFPLHPLKTQIEALELVSGKPVVAVTLNHEGIAPGAIDGALLAITKETGRPAFDVLAHGADKLAACIEPLLVAHAARR